MYILLNFDVASNPDAKALKEEDELWLSFTQEFAASGQMVCGEALDSDEGAFTLSRVGEEAVETAGPVLSDGKTLRGYYLVDGDRAAAAEWASRMPVGPNAVVEVRPVRSLGSIAPETMARLTAAQRELAAEFSRSLS